jgi:hypothetical protein
VSELLKAVFVVEVTLLGREARVIAFDITLSGTWKKDIPYTVFVFETDVPNFSTLNV